MEKVSSNASNSAHTVVRRPSIPQWLKLSLIAAGMMIAVLFVSVVLMAKSNERSALDSSITEATLYNVGGAVQQMAPSLNALSVGSSFYESYSEEVKVSTGNTLTQAMIEQYVENTNLVSTTGDVTITLDMKKRGLRYEPTYRTAFTATYILENALDTEAAVEFEFPFPVDMLNKEINNAMLLVDGVEQEKPVRKIETTDSELQSYDTYDPYGYPSDVPYPTTTISKSGLFWEGTIPAKGQREIEVRYNTVGLGTFSYVGMENPEGSQDLSFIVRVVGSRKYDNIGSLMIDQKEYTSEDGKNGVILTWDKPDLFSAPQIAVSIAPRVNPSEQLYEIYVIMVPLYMAFAGAVILMMSLLKKEFGGVDMVILAALFTVFFPFLHYLVSFNIDPSADVLVNYAGVVDFSMPLYGAFAIAFGVIGSLMVYLFGRVSGWSFAFGVGLPLIIVFMAFFPLAMTLPEYKYLLALIGIVAIMAVVVQMRVTRKMVRVE